MSQYERINKLAKELQKAEKEEYDNCRIGFGWQAYWGWEVEFSNQKYETENKTSIFDTDTIPCTARKKLFTRWDTYGDCQGDIIDNNDKTDDYSYPNG